MGVDKSNIRAVIHFGLPASAEAYIQEAGRGGRDGGHVEAVLIVDAIAAECPPAESLRDRRREAFHLYARTRQCRRGQLLALMGSELAAPCSGCDVCDGSLRDFPEGVAELKAFFSANPGRFKLRTAARMLVNPRLESARIELSGRIPDLPCPASGLLPDWDDRDLGNLLRSSLAAKIIVEKRGGQIKVSDRNSLEV